MKRFIDILVLAVLALGSQGIAAAPSQWSVLSEGPDGSAAPVKVAVVRDDGGHSLRIYLDSQGVVRGIFRIHDGFDRFAPGACPTYRIDQNPPVTLSVDHGRCRLDPQQAHFALGRVSAGRVQSDTLFELMNGTSIQLLYRLARVGYRRVSFTLSGSKQAIGEVIGTDVAVVGE